MAHVDIVRDLMAKVAAERGLAGPITMRPLNSGGANYTSALFSLSAGDLKVFAKIAIVGDKMRELMNADVLYKTEQIVYSELAHIYEDLLKKNEAFSFRFPTVYASLAEVGSETILMEDLTAQGYRTPTRQEPMDWKFATAAVTKLAAFHALSFAYQKEDPAGFSKMADRLKHIERDRDDNPTMKATWEKMIRGTVAVVRDEHKPKLAKLLSDLKVYNEFRRPRSTVVLAHGDYRCSNLMFKDNAGELDIVVVDFQTVHSGCPVSDLLYFIFLGSDQQFRRQHYSGLLDHYHTELTAALDALGVDVDEVYSREVFEKEVKEMIPAALAMSVVLLPIVLVDEEAAPQVAGDADGSQFAIEPSATFAERFAALVADCDDWGAL